MHIRFCRDADLASLCRLINELQRDRASELTPERLRQELARRGNDARENFLVLEVEGQVVGFCGYDPLPEGLALMEGPVVDPAYRGQGWGRRLWQELQALLADRGVRSVSLVLGADNQQGEEFALRLGFRREKTELIVFSETPRQYEVRPPEGVRVTAAGPDLDPVEYQEVHARLFARRSLSFMSMLAASPDYRIFVAHRGDLLVGFAEIELLGSVASIEALGVLPEERRRGIGRALLAAALNCAWAHPGIRTVRQIWRPSQPGYIEIYKQMGFSVKYAIRGLVREVEGRSRVGSA
jgi:ribosomal protein S18 acetylase RimI-like enzyme